MVLKGSSSVLLSLKLPEFSVRLSHARSTLIYSRLHTLGMLAFREQQMPLSVKRLGILSFTLHKFKSEL